MAGHPLKLWARGDLRASAATEGRKRHTSLDDAGKIAAHSSAHTTATVYDCEKLEAHRRFAGAGLSVRNNTETEQGMIGKG